MKVNYWTVENLDSDFELWVLNTRKQKKDSMEEEQEERQLEMRTWN